MRAIEAIRQGMRPTEVGRLFGVSRAAVHNWIKLQRLGGKRALKAHQRGRPKSPRLSGQQRAVVVRTIVGKCPDQMRLPFALWTREAVGQLLERDFGVCVSVWTVGRYLRSWGMTPQKPLRRAYEQDPVAVRRWLFEEYPAIAARAKRERAQIHWGDEMGLRSDHQTGTSWGLKGQTPVIPGTGKRFRCNMISTVTNRGRLAFMIFTERFNATVFLRFLKRLIRLVHRKIFLILDRHSVHLSAQANRWLARHRRQIELFFLPTYSPALNPDELLNQDVKSNALGRRRPENLAEMTNDLRTYLRSTQRRPDIVKNYFHQKDVRYAA
jgi:transposase